MRPSGDDRNANLQPLVWDDGPPWRFRLEVRPAGKTDPGTGLVLSGSFSRDADGQPAADREPAGGPSLVVAGGLFVNGATIARLDADNVFPWIVQLRQQDPVAIPRGKQDELLELIAQTDNPQVALPPELHVERVRSSPTPRLVLQQGRFRRDVMEADLLFQYDGQTIAHDADDAVLWLGAERRVLERDQAAERAAFDRLRGLGFRARTRYVGERGLQLTASHMSDVVTTLVAEGWSVLVDGRRYRQPSGWQLDVRSGVDWFELHGHADFGDVQVSLPALLEAVATGTGAVTLSDGTLGMLPEGFLATCGSLATLGRPDGDCVRFGRHQVGLLDALLAAEPTVTCDATFARLRDELCSFTGVAPLDPAPTFEGQLRAYHREALGWFAFLHRFGFGGCLADEMGLGKTVMVLALLDAQRHGADAPHTDAPADDTAVRPSLVVMPRSLIFNWMQEARRFAPALRLVDYTGPGRRSRLNELSPHDILLTTYGTLRRDAATLKDVAFDYVVLDEAQAIKNARTASAKATRLLNARHRLALSGTPIENHLGELWSLFEFLNPGLLGSATVFQRLGGSASRPDDATARLLARAVRPFVLRRTKDQVAPDLPAKHEQTVYCDLGTAQRAQYDELREYYRQSLLPRVDREGLSRSKILILQALLRLRQAACHPALLDQAQATKPSAKLEVLLARLYEIRQEGRKALVFSQFTTFLRLVRARLDDVGLPYEYLGSIRVSQR